MYFIVKHFNDFMYDYRSHKICIKYNTFLLSYNKTMTDNNVVWENLFKFYYNEHHIATI